MNNKKVAFFISDLGGGGAEKVFLNLVNEFQQNDVQHILILRRKCGKYLNQLNPQTAVFELSSSNPVFIIKQLVNVCKSDRIDILISTLCYNNILALIVKMFVDIKVVIREATTHECYLDHIDTKFNFNQRIKNKVIFITMKYLYPLADLIIANSQDTAKDIMKHVRVPDEKILVINNPVINEKVFELSCEPILNEKFLELTKPTIISAGRLTYQKNFENLLESFAVFSSTNESANLVIMGDGELKNELQEYAKKINITDKVLFMGFVDNPYAYLKASDLFVLTSRYEGFGNVIVEALAMGLPVVSTACSGGPREILANGKYGILVSSNEPRLIADAMQEALASPVDISLLIERAKDYSVSIITKQYLKAFEIIYR